MGKNIDDLSVASVLADGDKLYLGRSPYGLTDDFAILSQSIFPANSTVSDNSIVRFDGTTGKKLQGSTATIDDSGNETATSYLTSGTSGNGFAELNSQASIPAAGAANSVRLYSNAGIFSWRAQSDTFSRILSGTLTANRTYSLQDVTGTVSLNQYLPVTTIAVSTVLDATHWGKRLIFNSATAITITLPQQSTLATAIGIRFEYENIGVGDVTFVKQGAETLTGNTLCATNGKGDFFRDTTTDWFNSGGTSVLTGMLSFEVGTVGNVTYSMGVFPNSGTITNLWSICRSGTCTATFAINGSNITATPNSVSSSNETQAATAANTFVYGDYARVTISSNSTCLDMNLNVEFTYRMNI